MFTRHKLQVESRPEVLQHLHSEKAVGVEVHEKRQDQGSVIISGKKAVVSTNFAIYVVQ